MKQTKYSQGFSLVELMIVIAIIGILATISVNNYSDYVYRSRTLDALTIAQKHKAYAEEYYSVYSTFPPTATGMDVNATANISSVTYYFDGGSTFFINILINPTSLNYASGTTPTLMLYTANPPTNGVFVWTCYSHGSTNSQILQRHLPKNCGGY